jgi:hypothetical protein
MIRLEKMLTWTSAICYESAHAINEYIVTLSLHEGTQDQIQQNVAYQRLKWWISEVMHGSVMINQNDNLTQAYQQTPQRVLALPSDPVDHAVAMMLYLKINAIMEGRLILDEIKLGSEQGDHMCYLHSNEIDGIYFEGGGWWDDPGPVWQYVQDQNHESNVVNLIKKSTWRDQGLGWESPTETDQVIVVDFARR